MLLVAFCCCLSANAKKVVPQTALSFDREQQFSYYFYEAVRCYDQGLYDKAMAAWRLCEAISPYDAATNNELARLYEALQQKEVALEHYEKAYNADSKNFYADYANLLWQLNRQNEAMAVLEKARKQHPTDAIICKMLVNCYAGKSEYKKALKCIDQVEKLEGLTEYCAQSRYQLYMPQRKYKKAIEALNEYLAKSDPDDYRFPMLIATIYETMKDTLSAEKTIEAELQKHPDNPYAGIHQMDVSLKANNIEAFKDALFSLMRNENLDYPQKQQLARGYEKPLRSMHLASEVAKVLVEEHPFDWRAHADCAVSLQMDSMLLETEAEFRTAIDLNPKEQQLWKELFFLFDDPAKQETLVMQAYNQFPNSLMWHYYRSLVCMRHDSIDLAIEINKEAIENKEKADDSQFLFLIWTQLGDIYIHQEKWEDAFIAYEQAVVLNPDYLYALNNYAYTLAVHGNDLRKAERMSQKTITAEPNNPIYLDTYAWILHLQGQNSLAEFYMKKALQYISEEPDAATKIEDYQAHYDIIKNSK